MDKLTKKQRGFVKDYLETGNATQAVKNHYNVSNDLTARVIGSENLTKPNIIEVINEALTEDFLLENHKKLFDQKKVDYFIFPKNMENEEIIDHVNAQGIEVITVRTTDKGKMAFYAIPDAQAISKGLDMGYKLKGSYAAEKKFNVNVNVERTPELEEKGKLFDEWIKKQQT